MGVAPRLPRNAMAFDRLTNSAVTVLEATIIIRLIGFEKMDRGIIDRPFHDKSPSCVLQTELRNIQQTCNICIKAL
jgi:hypothetical protein